MDMSNEYGHTTTRSSTVDQVSHNVNVDAEASSSLSNFNTEHESTIGRYYYMNDESPSYTPIELRSYENVQDSIPRSPTYNPEDVPRSDTANNALPRSPSYTDNGDSQSTNLASSNVLNSINSRNNVPAVHTLNDRNDIAIHDEPEDSVIVSDRLDSNINIEVNEVLELDNSNDAPISNINEDSVESTSILPSVHSHSPDTSGIGTQSRIRKSSSPTTGPPAKVRKVDSEDTDYDSCPICLDSYQSSGDHRIASLKCGHIFGHSCLERWLKALPIKTRSCPTCKSKAAIRDMRYIYARRLVMEDSDRITQALEENAKLRAEKNKIELELEKTKIACRAAQLETEMLRKMLMKNQSTTEPVRKQWRFALEKNLQLCRDGGCRVLTYNCRTYEFYVSQKSVNYLFPGYGIRKVSCVDYKLGQFVHLHPKPIRDITYSQPRDLLLSVGLDCTARIVERGIPNITINAGMPLWSCSWDYMRTNEFYVGGVGGVIHQYDFRNPSTYIQAMRNTTDISPVASLCSTEYGLLSCQLNSSWLWVGNHRQWEPRSLPVDGSFMSLCYDNESHRALVYTRPNTSTLEKAKLTLCRLKSVQGDVTVDIEETFNGTSRSSLMSRATWVKVPGASWIAAHSESDAALFLHGLDGSRTMSLHAAEPAIDVCSVQLNGNTLLTALSESRMRIYKAVASS